MHVNNLILIARPDLIITADIDTRDTLNNPERRQFSASFTVYEADYVTANDLEDRYSIDNMIFDFGADYTLNLLIDADIRPSDFTQYFVETTDLTELLGSITGEPITVDSTHYYFGCTCGGQTNILSVIDDYNAKHKDEENFEPISISQILSELINVWENKHLKPISETEEEHIKFLLKQLSDNAPKGKLYEVVQEQLELYIARQ